MNIIEILLNGDPSVKRMTSKLLLGEDIPYQPNGWIQKFLEAFDSEKNTWGGGIYGPKWISTFYTLRDLMSLEVDPKTPEVQKGLNTLVSHMWHPDVFMEDDVCVVAMLVSMLSYGSYDAKVIDEMMQYLIDTQMHDGGWNCAICWNNAKHDPKTSSIHTTLSVLEAYRDYVTYGYTTHRERVRSQTKNGIEYLMRKKLMRREQDGALIFNQIDAYHFPTRWKYDYLRALVYLASVEHTYDPRMAEALSLLKQKIAKGYLGKGTTLSGRRHFDMERSRGDGPSNIGTMNTLRALTVLKFYEPHFYESIIAIEF